MVHLNVYALTITRLLSRPNKQINSQIARPIIARRTAHLQIAAEGSLLHAAHLLFRNFPPSFEVPLRFFYLVLNELDGFEVFHGFDV